MTYFMDVDWEQAVVEARAERDAAMSELQRHWLNVDPSGRHAAIATELAACKAELAARNSEVAALKDKLVEAEAQLGSATRTIDTMKYIFQDKEDELNRELRDWQATAAHADELYHQADFALLAMTNAYLQARNNATEIHTTAEREYANYERNLDDMWEDLQESRRMERARQAALDVMARDFAAARSYILTRTWTEYTESSIVAIALLEQALRSAQRSAQAS